MLELEFETFMDEARKLQKDNSGNRRKLHYLEQDDKFTLYIRSVEYWEYYTIIKKSVIIAFGQEYETDEEQAIKDFKTNFLRLAIPLKEKEVPVEDFDDYLQEPVQKQVDAGEDMVEESDDYETFLNKKFNKWEKVILSFVDETLKDEVEKSYVKKTIPDFLRRLFNTVHTLEFKGEITKIIKRHFMDGVHEVEDEIKIDIGFGNEFAKDVNNAVERQLEGFYIDGKRWEGLRGVTEDLQKDISLIVAEGVADKRNMNEIKNEIKSKFKNYTGDKMKDGRATKIARTEINRTHNFGKVRAFKESGLDGFKIWRSHIDDRTSPICKELNGQKVRIHDTFKTKDGEWLHPPSHPNCFIKGQKVLTDKGYKNIEKITTKDMVISHKNRFRRVITKFDNKYSGYIYTFKTNKGEIKCTANHPILTNNGWKEAQDITQEDYILCIKK